MERKQHIIDEWPGIGYTLCSQKRQGEAHRPADEKQGEKREEDACCHRRPVQTCLQATGWSFVDKLYEDKIQRKINKINFDRMLGKYQQEGLLAEKEKLERGYGCSV